MEKGYLYYRQALEKGLNLSIDVYHAILKATPFIKHGVVQKWELIEVSFYFLHFLLFSCYLLRILYSIIEVLTVF